MKYETKYQIGTLLIDRPEKKYMGRVQSVRIETAGPVAEDGAQPVKVHYLIEANGKQFWIKEEDAIELIYTEVEKAA